MNLTANLFNDRLAVKKMTPQKKRGRPKTGKKLDPNYALISGFVQKSIYIEAKHFLIDNDEFKDMGDFLEAAIVEFLSRQNYARRKKSTNKK